MAWGAVLIMAGFAIGIAVMKYRHASLQNAVVRSVVKLQPGHWLDGMRRSSEFDRPSRTAVALSRDGRFMVYSAVPERPGPGIKPQLYLRRTDQLEAKPVTGTEGGITPFLSPDDRWVGFWSNRKLMKVSIDGGVPVTLCNCWLPFGASWGNDNSIVFARNQGSELFRIGADRGKPEILTIPDRAREEFGHRFPHWLPGAKSLLFTIVRDGFDLQPRVGCLDLKTRKWSGLGDLDPGWPKGGIRLEQFLSK
jgi:hypothetical protein